VGALEDAFALYSPYLCGVFEKGMAMSPSGVREYEPFNITFEGGAQARAVYTPRYGDPDSILQALGLKHSPTIFVIGGAGLMEDESVDFIRKMVENGLAKFAQEHQVTIIDGGTAAGVMELIGEARQRGGYTFPLVGVAPHSQVEYPDHKPKTSKAILDRNHSHFVLTDGNDFGDESDMIAMLATALTYDRRLPALGLVINGGQIAQREVYMRSASGQMEFPLLVLEGSGRFADELSEAARTRILPPDNADQFRQVLAADVKFIRVREGADALRARLDEYFAEKT
jgi:hypothetical protein